MTERALLDNNLIISHIPKRKYFITYGQETTMCWRFAGIGILLLMLAYILMAISPLYLVFSILLTGIGLLALFSSFDRALIVLRHY